MQGDRPTFRITASHSSAHRCSEAYLFFVHRVYACDSAANTVRFRLTARQLEPHSSRFFSRLAAGLAMKLLKISEQFQQVIDLGLCAW